MNAKLTNHATLGYRGKYHAYLLTFYVLLAETEWSVQTLLLLVILFITHPRYSYYFNDQHYFV